MPSKRNPAVYFLDMLEAIRLINQYLDGVSFADFARNIEKQDSVNRRLEIIFEASHRLKDEEKALCAPQNWRAMHSLGNMFRHNYDSIVLDTIWRIVQNDLPPLKVAIEQTMREHFPQYAPR